VVYFGEGLEMKRKRIIIVLVILYAIIATLFPTFTSRTEKELIKRTLDSALINRELPDYEMTKSQGDFVISTENIDPKLISELPGVKYVLLSPTEIQKKADSEADFLYLRFKEVKIGLLKSSVSLENVWISAKSSNKGYLSGGGFTLTFYNILGRWIKSPIQERHISWARPLQRYGLVGELRQRHFS
jgi:hypothetical protein